MAHFPSASSDAALTLNADLPRMAPGAVEGTTAGFSPRGGTEADAIRSISTYMADEHTRVFDYNGRKLVTYLGEENFCGKRLSRVPPKTIEIAARQPVTAALLAGRLGYFPCARGQKVFRPNGDWAYTLLLCVEGEGWVEQGKRRWPMKCGSVALLRPFEAHAYACSEERPWSLYWVHFSGYMAAEYANLLTNFGQRVCFPIELNVRVIHAFEEILNTYQQGFADKQLVRASGLLHQILTSIWCSSDASEKSADNVKTRITRTLEVMKENPGSRMSIREFAAAASMSPMYFAEKFREYTRQTPRSYFTRVKMEKARELLGSTDLKVEMVAQAVGFDDAFYFSRVFKNTLGETPSGCRERLQRNQSEPPAE